MRRASAHLGRRSGRRPGAVLMETLIAVAIFVGAAAFALAAARSAFSAIERNRRQLEAADLARSKLAELDAGLISINDLRGTSADRVGSSQPRTSGRVEPASPQWTLDARTIASEFTGLTLVELTVREGEGQAADAVKFTLRQLVRLGRNSGSGAESGEASILPADSPSVDDPPLPDPIGTSRP